MAFMCGSTKGQQYIFDMSSDVIDLVVKVLMLSRTYLANHANVSICQNKIPL